MCGSGTIVIEAAMQALNKAPLIHRKKGEFDLENLQDFDYQLWRKTADNLRSAALDGLPQPIFAGDIDPR